MKKSLFESDRLIFAGMTCLVASILLGVILVVRESYAPTPTAVSAPSIIPASHGTTPVSTRPVVVTPPILFESNIYQLELELADNVQHRQANAFCVQWPGGRRYLVSHAGLLTQSDWQQVTRVSLRVHGDKQLVPVVLKPLYLGPFTEDHQPNLLTHPDLGLDLVVWSMPEQIKGKGYPLATSCAVPGEDVWVVALPVRNTNAQSHFHCRVLEYSDHALSIQPLDRLSLDQVIGLPVVNQRGEVLGNVLGGNDLTLIGASFQGLERQLKTIESK
ncbi:MAG TPA: hypothetical protein PLN21_00100 [Gemmatales bacterium]|nr:hypothetical protein [Gemmatales bacterium]